jgi:hypothetical protein
MQALYLFKLFCFIFAAITAFNLYTELTLSYFNLASADSWRFVDDSCSNLALRANAHRNSLTH